MLVCMEGLSEAQLKHQTQPMYSSAIVQMLKPGSAETFEEYARQIFIPYISGASRSSMGQLCS